MSNDIHRWVFQIPLEDVYSNTSDSKSSDHTTRPCCFLCGKPIKGTPKYQVHYLTNGNLVSIGEELEESQGFFPIGNECKKKLPNNFYFKKEDTIPAAPVKP